MDAGLKDVKTEPMYVAIYLDDIHVGVKGQSSSVIAGSLRNIYRYSEVIVPSWVKRMMDSKL
jgi:hypothetical protein